MNLYPTWVIPTGATTCLAYQHEGPRGARRVLCEQPVPVGSDLCEAHIRRFGRLLTDLAIEVGALENGLLRKAKRAPAESTARSAGPRDVGGLWNPHVAAVLYELRDWTGYLNRTVMRLSPDPDPWNRLDITRSVPDSLLALARDHHRWLAGWPTVGPDLLADALDLRAAAIRALNSAYVRRVGIRDHFCGHVVEETDFGPLVCMGQLVGVIHDPDDPKPSVILCETNPAHKQLDRTHWMAYAS